MRIVFMGTPDFAVPALQRILEDGHEVAAVFTQTDKPKGRGHQLAAPPVKQIALQHGIAVYQPKSLRNEETAALLREISPELLVVVAYGKLLPPPILEIPPRGSINIHASLLPKYRGAGPIQWSVINGEKVTGVTTMFMGEGIDTGDMLLSAETEIGENETAGELHDRLSLMGAELISETLERLSEGTLAPKKQEDALATHAPMLTKELSALDFTRGARELHQLIQGLSPWPCAEARLDGKRLKVYRSELAGDSEAEYAAGELLPGRELVVSCGDGTLLKLTEVQYEGSKRMRGEDFRNGHPISNGQRFALLKE